MARESKPTIEWVTEDAVRAGFERLGPRLTDELREIAGLADDQHDLACLLFDLKPMYAFESVGITTWTFDSLGRPRETALDGRDLLRGESLLDPRGRYPLGRADSPLGSTVEDVGLVERVMHDELRKRWREVASRSPRYLALAGVWMAYEMWDSHPLAMLDLSSGESRVHEFLVAAALEEG